MSADRIRIAFRGKVDGDGEVKVPKLTSSHVTLVDRGIRAILWDTTRDDEIRRRLIQYAYRAKIGDPGAYWPSYVSAETPGFTFTPDRSGFMARVEIELDANAMKAPRP